MHEVGLQPVVEAPHVADQPQAVDGIGAAAPPGQRMQRDSQVFNGRAIGPHTGGDMHFIAGLLSSQRHRQPVRAEIPVLGDQIEQPPDWVR